MKELGICITNVENGFIIYNDLYRGRSDNPKSWVARDVPELLKIVEGLVEEHRSKSGGEK